jgi:hypothetical protein
VREDKVNKRTAIVVAAMAVVLAWLLAAPASAQHPVQQPTGSQLNSRLRRRS